MIYDPCLGAAVCGLTNSFPSGMEAVTFLLYRAMVNHVPGCSGEIPGKAVLCAGETSITYTVPPIDRATSYLWTLPSGATGVSITNTITVDYDANAVSGELKVSGVNDYGAGGTSQLWITVNPIPETPVISQNGNVLSSSAPAGNQWYDANGILAGETGQTYTITATGDYYSIVTLNGCVSAQVAPFHAELMGITENETFSVQLYPNPVNNELTVELDGNAENVYLEILNATGQMLYSGDFREKTVIATDGFAPGLYLIRIKSGSGIIQRKVVKK